VTIKLHSNFAVHPGEWLRAEVVEPSGFNVSELAKRLHVSRQAMSNLLNGKDGLSPEMAVREGAWVEGRHADADAWGVCAC